MNKWIAEFELEDGDTMPEHMDLNYSGVRVDFHCRPANECEAEDCISRKNILESLNGAFPSTDWNKALFRKIVLDTPSVYPKSDKPYGVVINYCVEHGQILIDKDKYENLQQLRKANTQLKKQIEMLKLDRDCDKPSGRWISLGDCIYECSECHERCYFPKLRIANYCFFCGAKMESEDNNVETI